MDNLKLNERRGSYRFEAILKPSDKPGVRNVVIFEVLYLKTLGGTKGVRVSMRPSKVEQGEGYTTETTLLYNEANIGMWAAILARKNDKAVREVAEKLDAQVPAIVSQYITSGPQQGKIALSNAIQALGLL